MEPSGKFPNLNFNKERPISKGRATFKGSFFYLLAFWYWVYFKRLSILCKQLQESKGSQQMDLNEV